MRIEDELYLIERNMVPAGAAVPSRSIRDHNIMDLIDKLNDNGIEIDPHDSEQDIQYRVLQNERNSTVPLKASFEDPVAVVGYTLRNRNLEIGIRDYHKSSGTGARLGGTVHRKDGIHCSFTFEGAYEEAILIETAKKVLSDFYR
ncbi:MAG: hypothetical protein ACQESG_05730 [Nanobdellota archaeon]